MGEEGKGNERWDGLEEMNLYTEMGAMEHNMGTGGGGH